MCSAEHRLNTHMPVLSPSRVLHTPFTRVSSTRTEAAITKLIFRLSPVEEALLGKMRKETKEDFQ